METIVLVIDRSDVFDEVEKTTDFTGAKMEVVEAGVRDRIVATEAELTVLLRFWEEVCAAANERLKEFFVSCNGLDEEKYRLTLCVSVAFDDSLTESIEKTLRSFFVALVTGKWFVLSNKGDAQAYFETAAGLIEDVRRMLYCRRRPESPRS